MERNGEKPLTRLTVTLRPETRDVLIYRKNATTLGTTIIIAVSI
jgi:hypothetical protein